MKQLSLYSVIFSSLFFSSSVLNAGTIVYVPLGSAYQVVKINADTDSIVASYSGINNPHGLVATPEGEYVIAGSLQETPFGKEQDINSANSKLALIHPEHGHVMSTIAVVGWTHHKAITPDGRYIISTGASPNYTVVSPNGAFAYVSNSGDNSISEIDLNTWSVTRKLESGPAPEHI